MRLLPKHQDWTAYAYLIYFAYFTMVPFMWAAPAWQRIATVLCTLLGIALYFTGYWLRGWHTLWVVGAFTVMGTVFAPFNPGASVLFVYGAGCLGKAFDSATAYRFLAGYLVLLGLESWWLRLEPYAWIPALVFSALVGSLVTHFEQRRRLTCELQTARSEVEHMATVAERERIARDLHDLLGHTLSVIILKSELASRLTTTDPVRAAEEIRDVERISRDALAQVRGAVRGYRSAGFANEMREATRALETAGIQVEATVQAESLSPAQETVFSMALREAVTNVVRHAEATACRVSLRRSGSYCELEVADNGRGGSAAEGSGLIGMRERVRALGGELERDGSRGTLLRIRVPV
jgi:two-component system sensor histidine kinase DesK